MRRSTPSGEPEDVMNLRREAYLAGLNTEAFFIPSAVSQAVAGGGVEYTTCTDNQEVVPGRNAANLFSCFFANTTS